MAAIIPVDDYISAIDHDLFTMPGVGVSYVVRGDADRVAIVDTGTSLTAEATLAGLQELGIPREAVCAIICTHVHMDHAGGSTLLVDALPNASIYIHSATAPLLVQPERLMSSTKFFSGETLWPWQGTIKPVSPESLRPAEDLRLDLGRGIVLQAIPTPGHAADHVCFWIEQTGTLLSGDTCGIALPHYNVGLRPVTPPPGFDLVAQRASYDRLAQLPIAQILPTHCGPGGHDATSLQKQRQYLENVIEAVQTALQTDQYDEAALAAKFYPADSHPVLSIWGEMAIAGVARYLRKQQANS